MNELFTEEQNWDTTFLGAHEVFGKGRRLRRGRLRAKGLYRPEADCIMFTRDKVGFCRVCQRAIARVIDMYSR